MTGLLIIIGRIGIAILCGYMGSHRKVGGFFGFLFGALLPMIAFPLIAVSRVDPEYKQDLRRKKEARRKRREEFKYEKKLSELKENLSERIIEGRVMDKYGNILGEDIPESAVRELSKLYRRTHPDALGPNNFVGRLIRDDDSYVVVKNSRGRGSEKAGNDEDERYRQSSRGMGVKSVCLPLAARVYTLSDGSTVALCQEKMQPAVQAYLKSAGMADCKVDSYLHERNYPEIKQPLSFAGDGLIRDVGVKCNFTTLVKNREGEVAALDASLDDNYRVFKDEQMKLVDRQNEVLNSMGIADDAAGHSFRNAMTAVVHGDSIHLVSDGDILASLTYNPSFGQCDVSASKFLRGVNMPGTGKSVYDYITDSEVPAINAFNDLVGSSDNIQHINANVAGNEVHEAYKEIEEKERSESQSRSRGMGFGSLFSAGSYGNHA